MNIFESLENLNVSEECFNDIMGIVEEILSEGREPFETQQQYKRRLQQHFGPILNDKLASQKSIAKHYDKKAKGLKKETKKAYIENRDAARKNDEEYEKYHDSLDKSIEAGNAHGYDSDLYKKAKKEQEDAKIKRNEARENAKNSENKLRKARIEQYDAENSADIARGEQDEISRKIGKTGTHFYRH